MKRKRPVLRWEPAGFSECFWSGRLDSNQRPPEPHSGALPSCATPRPFRLFYITCALPSRPPLAARFDRRDVGRTSGTPSSSGSASTGSAGCRPRPGARRRLPTPSPPAATAYRAATANRASPGRPAPASRPARAPRRTAASPLRPAGPLQPAPRSGQRQPFREHELLDPEDLLDVRPPCRRAPRQAAPQRRGAGTPSPRSAGRTAGFARSRTRPTP